MTAAIATTEVEIPGQPCNAACRNAVTFEDECLCRCAGSQHGSNHRTRHDAARQHIRTRAQRAGGVFALVGAITTADEPW